MKYEKSGFSLELRDKIKYYETVEEEDKGNNEVLVHYISKVLMKQNLGQYSPKKKAKRVMFFIEWQSFTFLKIQKSCLE